MRAYLRTTNAQATDESSAVLKDPDDCARAECEAGWAFACPHAAWCGQHVFEHMEAEPGCRMLLGTALLQFLRLVILPGCKLYEQIQPARLAGLEMFPRLHHHFYACFLAAYEEAGAPLGDDEDAPLRWLEAQYDDASAH
jgi:hypothetical protein